MNSAYVSLLAAVVIGASLPGQNCTDNQFRLYLVNSQGVEAPNVINPATGTYSYTFTTQEVFLAFAPTLPSGTYYVHVTDPIGGPDEVLSTNDPLDRFVAVANNAGVITLSLPFTNGGTPPVFGLGLNGIGQSIRLAPFHSSLNEPCQFKAWYGDCWDLSNGPQNPYLLVGGFNSTLGQCCVRSYSDFHIGSGSGSDVCGVVFNDANGNGVRDAGEGGVGGLHVELGNGGTPQSATTAGNGSYCFLALAQGNYTVTLQLGTGSGYVVTTPASVAVVVNDCANHEVNFGVRHPALACNGHTIGFWRNPNGLPLVSQYGILATLPGLCLVNASGQHVAPATLSSWAAWLQAANATNMAYMLSAQLAAMHCNVLVGFVNPNCVANGGTLGNITIANLMQQAITSLCAHPYTPSGSPFRAAQEALKTALDRANNNLNWL